MPSTRLLRRRIRAARSTKQITRAQEMVATAKLRQSILAAQHAQLFPSNLERLLEQLITQNEYPLDHPWLHQNLAHPVLVVVIASDQGLAGTFTSNLLRQAIQIHTQSAAQGTIFLPIGRRIHSALRRLNYELADIDIVMPRTPEVVDATTLAETIIGWFETGKVGSVQLLSTHYRSALLQEAGSVPLLPVAITQRPSGAASLYEPTPDQVLATLLKQLLVGRLFEAYVTSKASEYAARRTAMHAATDNAGKLIDRLTLTYNRVRQAAITTEIAEIVGGAAALSS